MSGVNLFYMWVQSAVLLFFLQLWLLFGPTKRAKKSVAQSGNKSSAVCLGILDLVYAGVQLFLNRGIPNYEMGDKLRRIYGRIFIFRIPFYQPLAHISNLDLAKHLMSSVDWVNKYWDSHYLYSASFNKPIGLLFSNGDHWKESRKLIVKLLHQLDFYKPDTMEGFISFEMCEVETLLTDKITENGGQVVFSPHQMFEISALNIVCQVLMGRRFERDDPIAEKILSAANAANREFNPGCSVLDVFPWLRYIPRLTFMDSFRHASNVVYDYFKAEILEKRRKAGAYRTDPIDLSDYFLLEIDKQAGKSPKYITDQAFLTCMRDMVFAGSDTTNAVLEHGILHVSLNPDVQRKVQAEIDHVIGTSRAPVYEDRLSMPYTQATLLETMRFATPVPLTLRSPCENNVLGDHSMPKGSIGVINIYAIHMSEDVWEDPKVFRPERFLNQDGTLINLEKIMPFGHGKRQCMAEPVARVTLFIFFVTLLQKFAFELPARSPRPSLRNIPGLSRCPVPYEVVLKRRCNDYDDHKFKSSGRVLTNIREASG